MTALPLNLTSPQYPNPYPINSNATWNFRTDPGYRIEIDLIEFELETNFDYLTIIEQGKVSMSLTGSLTFPVPFVSSTNEISIHFISDNSNGLRGFMFRLSKTRAYPAIPLSQCGFETAATNENQTLGSPNWPLRYTDNTNCTWIITSPSGTYIRLYVESFDTEACCDTLSGYYRNTTRKAFRISGKYRTTQSYEIPTNFLTLKFVSDRSYVGSGFLLKFQAVDVIEENTLLPPVERTPDLNLAYVPYRNLYPESI